jgi:hypothetical protein
MALFYTSPIEATISEIKRAVSQRYGSILAD